MSERIYQTNIEFDHDLFKLSVETMKKNISWDGSIDLVSIEHCHFYHTVDSQGREQTLSSPIGGHFHEMKIVKSKTGGVPKVTCASGPMHMVKKKISGRYKKVAEPMPHDDHKHDVVYVKSDRIKPKSLNSEAAKVMSMNTPPQVEGVVVS